MVDLVSSGFSIIFLFWNVKYNRRVSRNPTLCAFSYMRQPDLIQLVEDVLFHYKRTTCMMVCLWLMTHSSQKLNSRKSSPADWVDHWSNNVFSVETRYLSDLGDSLNVVAGRHLVQKVVNPMLCDTSTAFDELLYAEGGSEHDYRLITGRHSIQRWATTAKSSHLRAHCTPVSSP